MKVTTPEISWHERDPIYSVDLQPGDHQIKRLVSGGVDKFVRVWQIIEDNEGKLSVDFLANLKRHTKAVNVCRFSHDGETLATAGDDAVIILWKLSKNEPDTANIFQEDEEDNKENWSMQKVLRGHLEDIYDVCWSADGQYMISGSVDNSAILWDLTKDALGERFRTIMVLLFHVRSISWQLLEIEKEIIKNLLLNKTIRPRALIFDQKMAVLNDHQSFVQGVAWDPKNEFAATLSTDRSCRVYSISSRICLHNIKKMSLPLSNRPSSPSHSEDNEAMESKAKSFKMFHDDTMRSFFRRLAFTPDGEFLIVPSGVMETEPIINSTYVFTRHSFLKPAVYLPSPEKVTIAVRCCPTKFQLKEVLQEQTEDSSNNNLKEWEKYDTLFELPYRLVFAVATEDSILLYDTQQNVPFGFITNVHYHQLSDLTWSSDGRYLVVSSTDGYCTLVSFKVGELGVPYTDIGENLKSTLLDREKDITMETDESIDDLHLVLDTSNDGNDLKLEPRENGLESKPEEITVKSAECNQKKDEITTVTTLNDDASGSKSAKPIEMKVKSTDGKPKNIKITTLCSLQTSAELPKPGIQVKTTDGKRKNVQVMTLASYTSQKSKHGNTAEKQDDDVKGDCKNGKVLSEITDDMNPNKVCDIGETVILSSGSSTPKHTIAVEDKQTPKRVQVTTLQLFQSPSSSKQNTSHNE